MGSMIKRDFYVSKMFFLFVLLFIPVIYAINLSPLFMIIWIVAASVFNLFYYDFHNGVNRSIVSFPINRKKVVQARYIFIGLVTILTIGFLWIIDIVAHNFIFPKIEQFLPSFEFEQLSLPLLLFTFLGIVAIVSVSIPVYYFAQSVTKALLIQLGLFLGVILFITAITFVNLISEKLLLIILDIIDYQPLLIIVGFVILCIGGSYYLSVKFFSNRDLI